VYLLPRIILMMTKLGSKHQKISCKRINEEKSKNINVTYLVTLLEGGGF